MDDFIDFESLARPSSPNTYLVAPATILPAADDEITVSGSPGDLFSRFLALIEKSPKWTLIASDASEFRIRFTAITSLLRFKDDVDIQITANGDDQSDLLIYSRSRVGYSDFGANRKRVIALVDSLDREQNTD